MLNTWLTGSGRFGLRRRALTVRSVVSESLARSADEMSADSGEVGLFFFMMMLPARFKKVPAQLFEMELVGHCTQVY
jgi:hypothetical protein